jgi:hypothetical protein
MVITHPKIQGVRADFPGRIHAIVCNQLRALCTVPGAPSSTGTWMQAAHQQRFINSAQSVKSDNCRRYWVSWCVLKIVHLPIWMGAVANGNFLGPSVPGSPCQLEIRHQKGIICGLGSVHSPHRNAANKAWPSSHSWELELQLGSVVSLPAVDDLMLSMFWLKWLKWLMIIGLCNAAGFLERIRDCSAWMFLEIGKPGKMMAVDLRYACWGTEICGPHLL